jgi:hypothetical protein
MAKTSSTHTSRSAKQVLTFQDAKTQVKEMKSFRTEIKNSKKLAGSFLQATGMYDKNSKLKKEYR